ncbi:MAG: 3-phosphoshikimate 1-carboxyvinyltransferase [Proteobacteria bacterium]|nr:MAG: 3-phosphoshikimate 1-carboxyvinyltransferase [Pseudomonadota bacterium]
MIDIAVSGPVNKTITVPGSKSMSQRALIAAALADGESRLYGVLESEDTRYVSQALVQMGVILGKTDKCWVVEGSGGTIRVPEEDLFLGNNGTATRFLTSVAALGKGTYVIDGDKRMRERPIDPLIKALEGWGVDIASVHGTGCPPLCLRAEGIDGGHTVLPEGKSSQYLSSLLLVAPYTRNQAILEVEGSVLSHPYVVMTLQVMRDFGVVAEAATDLSWFSIPQGCYKGRDYQIEGDASNASYFWAAAAITGGRVCVDNVPVPSLQGDAMLVPLLARMGCNIVRDGHGIIVEGPDRLEGISVDMGAMPDVVPTLAVVAAFAEGETELNNISHLRIKECDRLSGVVTELRKMGVDVDEYQDRMVIKGNGGKDMHGAEIETYNDHRMAMSMAVAGLKVAGIRIGGEQCVAKSFPDFWDRFESLSV